jgi:hypothetical protein
VTPSEHPGWNPALLRRARLDAGLTIEELGEAVAALDVPGFRQPAGCPETVRRHETGRHKPRGPYQRAYSAVLNKTAEQLGFRFAATDTTARFPHDGGVTSPQNPTDQPPPATEGADTNRRDVFELAAATTAGNVGPADRLAFLERTSAGDGAVSVAEHALRTVVADYLSQPPATTLARVVSVQRLADRVPAEYVLRPADTARLWTTAAVAAGIRGWLHNNAGDTDAARLSLREAHRRGELLDDDQIVAWARYMQATVEDHAGNTDAARRYTLDGIAHTARDSPQRALLLTDSLAGVLAAGRDTDGVNRAIDQAHTIISTLPAEKVTPPGAVRMVTDAMTTVGEFQFALCAGRAYARLGRPDRFADVTSQARAHADSWSGALYRADEALAVARATDPDLEHARALAGQSLALATPFQISHVGHRIDAVVTAAGTTPAGRDLAEEVRSWRAARLAPAV